jgi:arylsulfatase A-like enzyme
MPKTDKPNILILWGDDIGWWNVSAYNHGMMGYRTPHIDRIAKEGAMFTDWYGQQSCTAGRAAFITGQSPIRTGLTKVGMPGAHLGLQPEDPTIADLLKPLGYATGQFGKNHLGDRDEFLPTVHGFDEFFGNLYHLNAEQEPENPDYPKDPEFKKRFGPRGVLRSRAKPDGTQEIEDTGPLNTKRMETIDEEITAGALDFIERQHNAGKPFFCWWNSTRMHVFTHLKKDSEGKTGLGVYPDGMVEHDGHVGRILAKLDELGIADNTIVMWATDNGAEELSWPDGGATPFRGEKDTNWEGGWRVPCVIRWPGVIKPGTVYNDVFSHQDMLPTLLAAAGEPDIVAKGKKGHQAGAKTFKVHLDGFQPHAVFQRGSEREPAARIPVLERRRRSDGVALRRLEGPFPGAARRRRSGVAGAVRAVEAAQALQLAERPLRERGYRLSNVLYEMARGPLLHAAAGGSAGPAVPPDHDRVPAEANARTLGRLERARQDSGEGAGAGDGPRRRGKVSGDLA